MTLLDIVSRFKGLRALVIGDVMLDSYLEGTAHRLCREGPVPVVARTGEEHVPGGAANTAANLRALGASVSLLGVIGDDTAAGELRQALSRRGVPADLLLADPAFPTHHKLRILADEQFVVRFDTGGIWQPSPRFEAELIATLERAHAASELIIVSDYAYGAVTPVLIDHLRRLQAARPLPLVIDGKDLSRTAALPARAVTPNHQEALALVIPGSVPTAALPPDEIGPIARRLLELIDAEWAAVTLASQGVLLAGRDGSAVHLPAHPVARANDIGAGDSFTAAMALALAAGASALDAARIAIDAAGIAVTRRRTAVVEHGELLQRVSLSDAPAGDSLAALIPQLEAARAAGRRIVFTNGVFDLLHAGHVSFLRRAKELGDVLVVGVNGDAGARRLKGSGRPVTGERDRAALVAALDPVDHVLIFDEDTPIALIRALRPHIHVKGGDYAASELPEAAAVQECGGRVIILPLSGPISTSVVIERIVRLAQREEVA